jgi:hypothetical protein
MNRAVSPLISRRTQRLRLERPIPAEIEPCAARLLRNVVVVAPIVLPILIRENFP